MCFIKKLIKKYKKAESNGENEKGECLFRYFDDCPLGKRIILEMVFLACIAAPISYFMTENDVFEWWYDFTRAHESWELDEWFSVVFSLLLAFFVLAQHRFYVIKKIHKELMSVNQKLVDKEREECRQQRLVSLGNMASGLAHEINNAIQPIIGLGEFVRDGLEEGNNDKHLAYMNTIMNGAYHARGIIDNVLQHSHDKTMILEEYWVKAILLHSFNFCVSVLPTKTSCIWHGLDSLEESDERLLLRCNETSLSQIFFNLMKNASDAMDGVGEINIHVKRCKPNECLEGVAEAICIEITDTGSGIDEETMQKIFDPFFTTKDISQGTGLGLASVYALMQQHDGNIKVDSTLGEGTTFSLIFPVSIEQDNGITKITNRKPKGN